MTSLIGKLSLSLTNPLTLLRELNCLYNRRLYLRDYYPRGLDIFSEDWDNLIILDSCRYDTFEALSSLPGELERKISRGTGTREFLMGNFHGRSLLDTVYVTANPQLHWHRDKIETELHQVINVWRGDGWDSEKGTVPPEPVTSRAIKANSNFPEKRLVVHYLQPHRPFIGETGSENREKLPQLTGYTGLRPSFSKELYFKAYEENLTLTLPHVERLMYELPGKTVVTSDHGQLLGERAHPIPFRLYGHWRGNYTKELLEVPWLEYVNGERKNVVADEVTDNNTDDGESTDHRVEDRLKRLGYLN